MRSTDRLKLSACRARTEVIAHRQNETIDPKRSSGLAVYCTYFGQSVGPGSCKLGTWASPRFVKVPAAPRPLKQGLRDLGYLEGKSLVIEYRWANGRHEQLDVLATELVRVPMDVIFAPTTAAALAAKNATATSPSSSPPFPRPLN